MGRVGGPGGYPGGRLPMRETRQASRKTTAHTAMLTIGIMMNDTWEGDLEAEIANLTQSDQTSYSVKYVLRPKGGS